MKAGFFEVDITPRVGVPLSGFGPYLNRHSIGIRDPLKARAAAFGLEDGSKAVIVSCDLIGLLAETVREVRGMVAEKTGIPRECIMVQCTHTHSGPDTAGLDCWGGTDEPYMAILPDRIAKACIGAVERMEDVEMRHASVPCEGIGLNRENDKDAPPLEEVLRDGWRPAKPELTDTICQVFQFVAKPSGRMSGFMAYFGCHPVVCCQETRYIHGDFCGVAMNNLERENPGSTGIFLQGAQGDVNSCAVHKPEKESLLALDIVAARFANAVREGLRAARPVAVDSIKCATASRKFSFKDVSLDKLNALLAEKEAIIHAVNASDGSWELKMAVIAATALRGMVGRIERGEDLPAQDAEIQGVRLGPVAFLGAPFEIMQTIKNEVVASAKAPLPLIMSLANGYAGYAPDKTVAARGGYAVDIVPLLFGRMPYKDIHSELVQALLDIDEMLACVRG